MSAPSVELLGGGIRLRITNEEDRAALLEIRRTPEVLERWRGDDLDAEFSRDLDDEETTQFTIIDDDTGEVLGLIQFHEEEEPDYRHAGIDVFVAPAHHRRGIATAALSLLIQHAFETLGHHRITIDPAANNAAAIACYAGVGFKAVGVMRQYELQDDGTWADGLLMDLLSSEWSARLLRVRPR